ncbi:J domain-containing protein [Rhodovarius lipocyclicus]|uniref:J domain-containing protein n=1 Tax=Rhodovarius lipocyclicus TaxID=268410 RepID=UPI00135A529D|nr:J domain-containing protein [Rhodovarius lipocyclicus]
MSTPTAYPLAWPAGWPRTQCRQVWPGKNITLAAALTECQAELRRLGATNIVLSSNVTLGADRPADPGVVAYCTYDGMQVSIPCDRWVTVAGNLRAIAKTIEAMRGMERWGAKHMIKAMFQGFVALPAPKSWWEIIGAQATASMADIEAAYRQAARRAHPDTPTGSHAAMAELNAAMDQARKERS